MTTKNKSNKTYTGPITEQLLKLHWKALKNGLKNGELACSWKWTLNFIEMSILPNWPIDSVQFQSQVKHTLKTNKNGI